MNLFPSSLTLARTAMLASILLVSACGGSDKFVPVPVAGVALFTTAAGSLTLESGASTTYSIGGGGGGALATIYSATSTNPAIISASVSGDKLTLKANGPGSANITIRDSSGSGQFVSIAVTVPTMPFYSSAQSAMTIDQGTSPAYLIRGGTEPYTVTTSNASVATAKIADNQLTISGLAGGSATVAALDASGARLQFTITVPGAATPPNVTPVAFYSSALSDMSIDRGASPAYLVRGGTGPYTATTSNANVATARIDNNELTISALASGTATIAALDATGARLQFTVTVPGAPSLTALYSTAQSAISIAGGVSSSYVIGGGYGPYSATSSNTSVATVSVTGNTLAINGLNAGLATVAVFDANGTSVKTDVTVNSGDVVALYTTAPSPLGINAGGMAYSYIIAGGKPPYTVNSSVPTVVSGTVIGNALTITGIANGSANVVVFDSLGVSRQTAVVVGTGMGGVGTPLFTSAQSAITVATGSSTAFLAGGGAGPYSVTTDNTAVATATMSGQTLTINAVGLGSGNIRVTDAANTAVTIKVTVGTANMMYTTAPASLTIFPGASPTYTIRGGVGPYLVTSSAVGYATVSSSGSSFTISGVSKGEATVNVLDSVGNLVTISVTVP